MQKFRDIDIDTMWFGISW